MYEKTKGRAEKKIIVSEDTRDIDNNLMSSS